jgi:aminoglycoside phosphotransferase (APT) family kinase protein
MADPPGPLIASGRAADVFDLEDGTVLRRYRGDGRETGVEVDVEARIMRHVAGHGYPVPTVHSAEGSDIVMDRVDGPTMMQRLEASPWKVLRYARMLADLQRRLARIEAPAWMLADSVDASRPQSVLHLDLHPMNVILSARGPVVIDWTNAAGGPEGFDGALTYVEISTWGAESPAERVGQQVFARAFRRSRGRRMIDAYVTVACEHRLADRNLLPDERVAVAALRSRFAGRN